MDWKTLTSLGRFKDIVMVLLRYGFDDLVDHLNIPGTKFMRKKSPIDQRSLERDLLDILDLRYAVLKT